MKICLYTGSALPKLGGQEAVVDALARQFLQLGHEPTVLAPRPRLPLLPNDSSLPYRVLRHPRFFSTVHFVGSYRLFLKRAASRFSFDVIHCHDVYPTGYVASLLRAELKIPLVFTSHGGDVRPGNSRLTKPGIRSRCANAIRVADALISIGQFTREGFLQLGADERRIETIPNGVDLQPFNAAADRPADLDRSIIPGQYILFLGRLSRRKGVDVLLNALAKLPATGSVELVIAGTGDERAAIEQLINQLNLQSRIRLVGRVTGPLKTYLLQNAICLAIPSRGWEAFPLVVLESYAAGRPVIGSRIAGLEDIIMHDKTGLLIPAESETEWAAAMRQLRVDPSWANRAGSVAKAEALAYGWDQIAARHIELYQRLMAVV